MAESWTAWCQVSLPSWVRTCSHGVSVLICSGHSAVHKVRASSGLKTNSWQACVVSGAWHKVRMINIFHYFSATPLAAWGMFAGRMPITEETWRKLQWQRLNLAESWCWNGPERNHWNDPHMSNWPKIQPEAFRSAAQGRVCWQSLNCGPNVPELSIEDLMKNILWISMGSYGYVWKWIEISWQFQWE